MKDAATVFISIGSNLGSKHENCLAGIKRVDLLPDTRVVSVSSFYKTEPVDFLDQDWFVNGALKIETRLDPAALLTALKAIEQELGQFEKSVRFGPRILDLDIILFDQKILDTDHLTIPHPRMHKRCFVLRPLCDIGANSVHPVIGRSTKELLMEIENDPDQKVVYYRPGGLP